MKIGTREISDSHLFFVVEEGQYNQGSLPKALKMIELATEAGADAIEFQLALAGDLYVRQHPGYGIYKSREFSKKQLKAIADCCRQNRLELVVAPFSIHIVRWMEDFGCSAFNINASDLNNPDILSAVVETSLPFFMSLTLATSQEVAWARAFVETRSASNYILLHGQHTMTSGTDGVSPVDTSLGYLQTIKQNHDGLAGFIDHTPLPWFPACAAAAGANVITKHMAPNHSERGPDWQICLDPNEMKAAIRFAREVRTSIAQTAKVLAPGENLDRSEMRRSIVFAKTLPAGHIVTREDLAFKRPGTAIPPDQFLKFVGQKLVVPVMHEEQVKTSHFGNIEQD